MLPQLHPSDATPAYCASPSNDVNACGTCNSEKQACQVNTGEIATCTQGVCSTSCDTANGYYDVGGNCECRCRYVGNVLTNLARVGKLQCWFQAEPSEDPHDSRCTKISLCSLPRYAGYVSPAVSGDTLCLRFRDIGMRVLLFSYKRRYHRNYIRVRNLSVNRLTWQKQPENCRLMAGLTLEKRAPLSLPLPSLPARVLTRASQVSFPTWRDQSERRHLLHILRNLHETTATDRSDVTPAGEQTGASVAFTSIIPGYPTFNSNADVLCPNKLQSASSR